MTLATVLEQALRQRDLAFAALRRAEDQLARIQTQAAQLRGYRGDYRQRWGEQFSALGAIEIVHCYQSFAQRLDEALTQQQQQQDGCQSQCGRLRQQLLAAELRLAAVQKLMQRRAADAAHLLQRQEQRQRDDATQQRHWHVRHAAAEETR